MLGHPQHRERAQTAYWFAACPGSPSRTARAGPAWPALPPVAVAADPVQHPAPRGEAERGLPSPVAGAGACAFALARLLRPSGLLLLVAGGLGGGEGCGAFWSLGCLCLCVSVCGCVCGCRLLLVLSAAPRRTHTRTHTPTHTQRTHSPLRTHAHTKHHLLVHTGSLPGGSSREGGRRGQKGRARAHVACGHKGGGGWAVAALWPRLPMTPSNGDNSFTDRSVQCAARCTSTATDRTAARQRELSS